MTEILVLRELSSIIAGIAQGWTMEAKSELQRLIDDVEGANDLEARVRELLLDGLRAANAQITADRPAAGAADLWRLSRSLWASVVPEEASRIPGSAPQGAVDGPAIEAARSAVAEADGERKTLTFQVTRRGPAYRTLVQAARILRTNADTIRGLLSRGELLGEQLMPNGPVFVSNKSIADYQTRLFQATVAANRKKPQHGQS